MKVERNRAWNKYTLTPEDEKDEKLLDRIAQLEEENKKLKSDLAFERTMLDNVSAEYKSLQNVIKKLEDIQEEIKPAQKSKTITVTDEDNRIILEKGEDGRRHSYWGGNVVLC